MTTHTVTLNGQIHGLFQDEGTFFWVGPVPTCPGCGIELEDCSHPGGSRIAMVEQQDWDTDVLHCPSEDSRCGNSWKLTELSIAEVIARKDAA